MEVLMSYGGIRWIATLSDSRQIVGRPSTQSTGKETDWAKLKREIDGSDTLRIVGLALYTPFGRFDAPANRGNYGYYEVITAEARSGREGLSHVCMCWPEIVDGRDKIVILRVSAAGILDKWLRSGWLPCMTGKPELPHYTKQRVEERGS